MENEKPPNNVENSGEMQRRRETMADGKRYIIYYSFETNAETAKPEMKEESKNV